MEQDFSSSRIAKRYLRDSDIINETKGKERSPARSVLGSARRCRFLFLEEERKRKSGGWRRMAGDCDIVRALCPELVCLPGEAKVPRLKGSVSQGRLVSNRIRERARAPALLPFPSLPSPPVVNAALSLPIA